MATVNVLLVDDEEPFVATLTKRLTKRDLDITAAFDGKSALEKLAAESPQKAEIVKLRYFTGLEHAEIAEVLGVSLATVNRDWRAARAWLTSELRS